MNRQIGPTKFRSLLVKNFNVSNVAYHTTAAHLRIREPLIVITIFIALRHQAEL